MALELLARAVIAAVFVYAAVGKMSDVRGFAEDIANYQMLPDASITFVALTLPLLELFIGLALVSGVGARGASLLAVGLLLAFSGAMVQALARGIDLECGCFGEAAAASVDTWTVARNMVLAAIAAAPLALGITPWPRLVGALRRQPSRTVSSTTIAARRARTADRDRR